MKTILMSFMMLTSLQSFSSTKVSCEVLNANDDYAVEIFGEKAAFFDNDTWTEAKLEDVLESDPVTLYFVSKNGSEDFTILFSDFFEDEETTIGTLSLKFADEFVDFRLDCKKTNKLIYLK